MKKSLYSSIKFACEGLAHLIRTERNFRIQLIVAIVAVVAGAFFRITAVEWLFVASAIFRVLGHESVNTSVELLSDECEHKQDLNIKHIKDMSAAYVLLSAIYSLIVAVVIFLPRILQYIR